MKTYRCYKYNGTDLIALPTKNLKTLWWGLPAIFYDYQIDNFHLSMPIKNKLKKIKPGTILKLCKISLTDYHVVMLDTSYDQDKIDALEKDLKQVNEEINVLVGDKIKIANQIRNELKKLRGN
jgi:hypothetical protein